MTPSSAPYRAPEGHDTGRLAAVLWDMDGTLVETESFWIDAEKELVGRFGGRWTTDHGLALVGQDPRTSAVVLQQHGVALTVAQIVSELTSSVLRQVSLSLAWRPGVLPLLQEIQSSGIPMALVTSSPRAIAQNIAGRFPGPGFDVVVSSDDVSASKPDPAPYLQAARRLGVDPAECVAIEDSPAGLTSAVRAGVRAIGVPYLTDLNVDGHWTRWQTLEGRRLKDLQLLAENG